MEKLVIVKKLSHISTVLIFSSIILLSGILWWNFGSGISEKTALNFASDYAQDYAIRNNLDLTKYNKPKIGLKPEARLYAFSWLPNSGGKPLTIVVDAMTVETHIEEFPD